MDSCFFTATVAWDSDICPLLLLLLFYLGTQFSGNEKITLCNAKIITVIIIILEGGAGVRGGQMSRIPSHPAPPLNAAEHFRILRCHGYEMACRCTTCYGRPVSTHTAQYRRRRCLYVPGPPHPSRRRLKAIAGVMKRDRLPSTATIHGL